MIDTHLATVEEIVSGGTVRLCPVTQVTFPLFCYCRCSRPINSSTATCISDVDPFAIILDNVVSSTNINNRSGVLGVQMPIMSAAVVCQFVAYIHTKTFNISVIQAY